MERRATIDRTQRYGFGPAEALQRRLARRAMDAHIGNVARPCATRATRPRAKLAPRAAKLKTLCI
jgi:hypothetical protein